MLNANIRHSVAHRFVVAAIIEVDRERARALFYLY